MHARTFSATHHGLDGQVIEVEASLQKALPQIHVTGLPGDVVRESRERVRACLGNLGFEIPTSRLVVHLSPASARKQGSQFDLAIALAVLAAEGLLPRVDLSRFAFLGELALDGRIQAVPGAVALIEALERSPAIAHVVLSRQNAWEAGLVSRGKARLVGTMAELISSLRGEAELEATVTPERSAPSEQRHLTVDDVIGQALAKRALQICLAGRHHLLMVGPPGVGKSLLASCAPSLLPPLGELELVQTVKNQGMLFRADRFDFRRPFRSPHHSISAAAMLGGGSGTVIPGEVTLAHGGVLFLDEFPEFRRDVVEGIREPLQNGEIHLHRIGHALSLPARFTLIAAMNPCPCGYSLTSRARCLCPPEKVRSYRKRVSGPLMDRMDLCVVLTPPRNLAKAVLPDPSSSISHEHLKRSVWSAWRAQSERYRESDIVTHNGDVACPRGMAGFGLGREEQRWLDDLGEKDLASFRGMHKVLKVARTIADLDGQRDIAADHLREAWNLRCQDLSSSPFGC